MRNLAAHHQALATLPVAFLAIWAGYALRSMLRARSVRHWAEPDLMRALLYAGILCALGATLTDPRGTEPLDVAFLVGLLLLACWDDWRRWRR